MTNEKIGAEEASKILGISKAKIYKQLRSGELKGEKTKMEQGGRKWVIDKEEIEKQSTTKENDAEDKMIETTILLSKDKVMNELMETATPQNKQIFEKRITKIVDIIATQNEHIKEQMKYIKSLNEKVNKLKNEIYKLRKEYKKPLNANIKISPEKNKD